MPILLALSETRWRLYFSGRDARNRSHGFAVELDLQGGVEMTRVIDEPLLAPGPAGAFDADGAMPSALIRRNGELWLYYVGWTVHRDVPFRTAIGQAISTDNGLTFRRTSENPVLGWQPDDPMSVSSPHIVEDQGGLCMFYSSIQSWTEVDGRLEARYCLKRADSSDGSTWRTSPGPVVALADANEGGLARPTILKDRDRWHMWFSRRGWSDYRAGTENAYRLAYAWSNDGERWNRSDALTQFRNPPISGDWDHAMQAYPAVLRHENDVYCFYSGDGFGQAGIGYATLEGGAAALPAADATTNTM